MYNSITNSSLFRTKFSNTRLVVFIQQVYKFSLSELNIKLVIVYNLCIIYFILLLSKRKRIKKSSWGENLIRQSIRVQIIKCAKRMIWSSSVASLKHVDLLMCLFHTRGCGGKEATRPFLPPWARPKNTLEPACWKSCVRLRGFLQTRRSKTGPRYCCVASDGRHGDKLFRGHEAQQGKGHWYMCVCGSL